MGDHRLRGHRGGHHGILLKSPKELGEGVYSEQQGYMGPPSKAYLGPSWASVPKNSPWMGSLLTGTHRLLPFFLRSTM